MPAKRQCWVLYWNVRRRFQPREAIIFLSKDYQADLRRAKLQAKRDRRSRSLNDIKARDAPNIDNLRRPSSTDGVSWLSLERAGLGPFNHAPVQRSQSVHNF